MTNNVANEKVQDNVKKSEKNTQDVQKNCLSLTERWKKGELEQGYYYTKYNPKVGKPFVEIELRNYLLDLAKVRDADTVEVIAPVPSYDHFVELTEKDKENAKLKELLEQASYYLIGYKNNDTLPERAFYEEEVSEFLEKIDEVLNDRTTTSSTNKNCE